MLMRVLVTGGAGYIGSVTIERLLESGRTVVALDSLERGHARAISPGVEFIQCDLRDGVATQAAVTSAKADAIMHFAALHLVPESVSNPGAYFQANVAGGINLLCAARDCGISRIAFSSTAAVYGEPESLPVKESDPKNPINPYGHSKYMVEQFLPDFEREHGLKWAAFRYFNVAGATEAHGEDHNPETHVIPVALQVLMGKRERFTIFGTDYPTEDGTCIRDYIHVVDLADAHIRALDILSEKSLGAVNLGTRDGFSVKQIVEAVERVTGCKLPTAVGERRAGDPPALIADTSKAEEMVGWNPTRSNMDEMIGSAWKWMQANPEGYGND
jgi:UDP-glucose 4-epimerase